MDYYQVTFTDIDPGQQDMLIGILTFEGYEGYEQTDNSLKAYINKTEFDATYLPGFCHQQGISYSIELIKDQNWNQLWESNFEPVIIKKEEHVPGRNSATRFVGIRADFHKPLRKVEHEIIITPKMSFGTGHHSTTHLMVSYMGSMDFNGKTVMDFGTGTGVLAILAEKLGAINIIAIDNDEWSISNAEENIGRNGCKNIQLIKAENANVGESFDIILANINRNVILENLAALRTSLKKGGTLLVSGLLEEDNLIIGEAAHKWGFQLAGGAGRNKLQAIKFIV